MRPAMLEPATLGRGEQVGDHPLDVALRDLLALLTAQRGPFVVAVGRELDAAVEVLGDAPPGLLSHQLDRAGLEQLADVVADVRDRDPDLRRKLLRARHAL